MAEKLDSSGNDVVHRAEHLDTAFLDESVDRVTLRHDAGDAVDDIAAGDHVDEVCFLIRRQMLKSICRLRVDRLLNLVNDRLQMLAAGRLLYVFE